MQGRAAQQARAATAHTLKRCPRVSPPMRRTPAPHVATTCTARKGMRMSSASCRPQCGEQAPGPCAIEKHPAMGSAVRSGLGLVMHAAVQCAPTAPWDPVSILGTVQHQAARVYQADGTHGPPEAAARGRGQHATARRECQCASLATRPFVRRMGRPGQARPGQIRPDQINQGQCRPCAIICRAKGDGACAMVDIAAV